MHSLATNSPPVNTSSEKNFRSSRDEDHNAEQSHIHKPSKKKWQRLVAIAEQAIAGEMGIDPRGHIETTLFRIAQGQGAKVPLFHIQQNPSGLGFISDVQARVFYLRKQYGFRIGNEVDHSTTAARSWYWIELNDEGTGPKMNAVEFAAEKTGVPKAQAKAAPAAKQEAERKPVQTAPDSEFNLNRDFCRLPDRPSSLFGEMGAQPSWKDPEMSGGRRGR